MKWHHWFYGLAFTFIFGSANALVVVIADPLHFNFENWPALLKVAVASGAFNAFLYLKQSPLPPEDSPEIH